MVSSNLLFAAISVPKLGVLRHVGLLLPNGFVVHCAPGRGEHSTTLEHFASGHDVTIHTIVPPDQWSVVLARIAEALQHPRVYHPTANNCEMFVNRMLSGQSVSPQLQAIGGILVFATFVKLIASAGG